MQKFTNARLNAVQALYASTFEGVDPVKLTYQFLHGEVGNQLLEEDNGSERFVKLGKADAGLFTKIVDTAQTRKDEIDTVILSSLSDDWDKTRMEVLLMSILRAGIAEFFVQPDLDAPILINEYTNLARAFYEGPEVRLVNAVLDKFSKVLRG